MDLGVVLLSAAATGLAVVTITALAQRVGPTAGGLLATAPVTSTAALVYLAVQQGNEAVARDVLRGAGSLVAATFAMPLYAVVIRRVPGSARLRTAVAMAAFVAMFSGLAVVAATQVPGRFAWVFPIVALLVAALAARRHPVSTAARPPPGRRMGGGEAVARAATGAGVILLVEALRQVHPALGVAWAVFPGTFLVTLGVLSLGQGPDAGARVAVAAIRGVPALVMYLLVVWVLLPLAGGSAWAWTVQVPAWGAYFAVLVAARRRTQGPRSRSPLARPGPAP